jgi:hypothetical protein
MGTKKQDKTTPKTRQNQYRDGLLLFGGIPWGIYNANRELIVTNTCRLDSLLVLLYLLHRCKVIKTQCSEVEQEDSLLFRSFALMDEGKHDKARYLWIDEFHNGSTHDTDFRQRNGDSSSCYKDKKLNLWVALDAFFFPHTVDDPHPLAESCKMMLGYEKGCSLGGECMANRVRRHRHKTSHGIRVNNLITRRMQQDKVLRCEVEERCREFGLERTEKEINDILEEHNTEMCGRAMKICSVWGSDLKIVLRYAFDEDNIVQIPCSGSEEQPVCTGRLKRFHSEIRQWPHLLVFSFSGNNNYSLSKLHL